MKISIDNELLCPECGFNYTHLDRVEEYTEKDGRFCAKLHFYCENGCEFVIDFHQHEGITFVNEFKKVVEEIK